MLNLFSATRHHNYAKSARLYLQIMKNLPVTHPWLYKQFAENGHHAVRRSDRFWAGISTDLSIEQILTSAIKVRGGLTTGRGFTEAVRTTWVYSLYRNASLTAAVNDLTKIRCEASESHIDTTASRVSRDYNDVCKLLAWFKDHDPFDITDDSLRSLSTGLCSSNKDGVNCDEAKTIGEQMQREMNGKIFSEVSLKRKHCIKPLDSLQNLLKVDNEPLHVDSGVLFSRLIIQAERSNDLKSYFKYELSHEPPALFKNCSMRKNNKSVLAMKLKGDIKSSEKPN